MSGTWSQSEEYCPGNSTRYLVVVGEHESEPYVCIPNMRRGAVMTLHPQEWTYVANKLDLSEGDAKAVLTYLHER